MYVAFCECREPPLRDPVAIALGELTKPGAEALVSRIDNSRPMVSNSHEAVKENGAYRINPTGAHGRNLRWEDSDAGGPRGQGIVGPWLTQPSFWHRSLLLSRKPLGN